MPLTPDERRDILAYLADESDAAGEDIGLTFILDRWDNITNATQMERKALRREIRVLREQRPIARADLDVIMIAPKAPGHTVRSEFVNGGGLSSTFQFGNQMSGKDSRPDSFANHSGHAADIHHRGSDIQFKVFGAQLIFKPGA